MDNDSPDLLAERCCQFMHQTDYLAQSTGMTPGKIAAGTAEVTMTVREDMLNGFGTCHGGMIFSLADTAFAYACNSRNAANVALDCRIDFIRPVMEGEVLTAQATETYCGKRSGVYSITVTNQHKKIVATFTGRSYHVDKPVLPEEKTT